MNEIVIYTGGAILLIFAIVAIWETIKDIWRG